MYVLTSMTCKIIVVKEQGEIYLFIYARHVEYIMFNIIIYFHSYLMLWNDNSVRSSINISIINENVWQCPLHVICWHNDVDRCPFPLLGWASVFFTSDKKSSKCLLFFKELQWLKWCNNYIVLWIISNSGWAKIVKTTI